MTRTPTQKTLLSSLLVLTLAALPADARSNLRDDEALRVRLQAVLQADGAHRRVSLDELTRAAEQPNDLALSRAASDVLRKVLGAHLSGLLVSCRDGVLSLRGRVSEAADLYRAGDLCRALDGVRAVDNGLMTLDGQRLVTSQTLPTADPSRSFSFVTRDMLGGAGLTLSVADGVVTVRGTINGDGARRWVILRLRSVRGVRVLRDQLSTRGDKVPENLGLAIVVHFKMESSDELRDLASGLTVSARSGVVHLEGIVESAEQRLLAEALALSTKGVLVVSSDLTVAPPRRILARGPR